MTYFIYDGERPIYEFDPSGGTPSTNVYGRGIDEIIARSNNGAGQYPMQDREGSVILVTGGDGTILESYRFDAFGAPTMKKPDGTVITTGASLINNRFLFTGREYAAQYGFYEYRARAYHPGIGRFMSEDPMLFVRGMALGKAPDDWSFSTHPDEAELNLFRYCHNAPINKTDPMGLYVESAWDVLNISLGVASLTSNIRQGNWGAAALDGLGVVLDGAATALPLVPGGAGATIKAVRAAGAADKGGLVIGKTDDLAKATGWRKGDHTLNLPKLPPGPERWAQNAKELQHAIDKGKPIRDVSPTKAGGFLDRERALLKENGWTYDRKTQLWSPPSPK